MSSEHAAASGVRAFVEEMRQLATPARVHWCDGSRKEYDDLCAEMVRAGTFIPLNQKLRPGCFLARSHPSDVARVEDRTYICSRTREEAGPTNHWADPREMKDMMRGMMRGAMAGRTMYVIPFSMGPLGSPVAKVGIQVTDSPYVVVNMAIMTRVGTKVLENLGTKPFIPCVHSIGAPLAAGASDVPGPVNPIRPRNTSSTSPMIRRSGHLVRVTAATPCSGKNAWRCASPRSWRAVRVGWPNTC